MMKDSKALLLTLRAAALMVLGAFCMTACSSDDDDSVDQTWTVQLDNNDSPFSFTENKQCYGKGTISKDDFNKHIAGHGWQWQNTWKINPDGKRASEPYYQNMIGASPSSYYFGTDGTVKDFYISDAVAYKKVYKDYRWTFDEGSNSLIKNRIILADDSHSGTSFDYLQILGWTDDSFCAIHLLAYYSDGTPVYGVSTFKKMSGKTLSAYNKNYKSTE